MTVIPPRPVPGPHDPTTTTPPRAPGSVRRTSSLDASRPDGAGGPLLIDARARDVVTELDGSTIVAGVELRLTLDEASREIVAVDASPAVPGIEGLVGTHVVGGFRRVLVGVASCTHLNDTFRSLADLGALLPLLPR